MGVFPDARYRSLGMFPDVGYRWTCPPVRRGHVPRTGPALGIMPWCPHEGAKNEHVPRKEGTEPAET